MLTDADLSSKISETLSHLISISTGFAQPGEDAPVATPLSLGSCPFCRSYDVRVASRPVRLACSWPINFADRDECHRQPKKNSDRV
jgi:hypothetical protein